MRKILPILLCLFVFGKSPAQEDSSLMNQLGKNREAGRVYIIRGLKMYTETYGKGQPLLFIHGNGGSMKDFANQLPYFSRQYKVIFADSRAQGRTEDGSDSLSYEQMSDDYAALLNAMRIDSAYVVGWSDGGIIGLLLAMRHPSKVKKMAITGANLRPDSTAVYPDVSAVVNPTYDSLKNRAPVTPENKTLRKLFRLLVEEPHISLTDLKKVKCPTLVIGGDQDVIREEHTLEIYQALPRANLWILPNSGHSTPIRYREQFNRTVGDFFTTEYKPIRSISRFY